MDERERAPKKISNFLNSGRLPWVTLMIFMVYWGFHLLEKAINPPDQNSIVLINMSSSAAVEFPLHVSLTTDSKRWSRTFETGRLLENGGLTVLRWDPPFMFGRLEIRDCNDVVVVQHTLRPPARYSGAFVIELPSEGEHKNAFNALPKSH